VFWRLAWRDARCEAVFGLRPRCRDRPCRTGPPPGSVPAPDEENPRVSSKRNRAETRPSLPAAPKNPSDSQPSFDFFGIDTRNSDSQKGTALSDQPVLFRIFRGHEFGGQTAFILKNSRIKTIKIRIPLDKIMHVLYNKGYDQRVDFENVFSF
jgi:hypothetical protein